MSETEDPEALSHGKRSPKNVVSTLTSTPTGSGKKSAVVGAPCAFVLLDVINCQLAFSVYWKPTLSFSGVFFSCQSSASMLRLRFGDQIVTVAMASATCRISAKVDRVVYT